MDWIRRNWPDLLIGLALILVISGIIITLLNGGTFNPFGQRGAGTASLPSRPAASEQATQDADTQLGAASDADVAVLPLPSVGDQNAEGVNQAEANQATTTDSILGDNVDSALNNAGQNIGETAAEIGDAATDASEGVLPDNSDAALSDTDALSLDSPNVDTDSASLDSALTDDATLDGEVTGTQQSGSIEAVLPDDSADSSLTDTGLDAATDQTALEDAVTDTGLEAANAAVPADIAASSSATAPYRISAGTFGVAANAENLASELRAASYPVFTARQGDLTVVLVGPYDERGEAEQVAAQMESAGLTPGTEIYEFDPSDSSSPAASSDNTVTSSTEAQIQDGEGASSEGVVDQTQVGEAQTSEPGTSEIVAAPLEETTPANVGGGSSEEAIGESIVDSSANEVAQVAPATGTNASVSVPATSETGTYLQVGAYGSVESSNPQRRALEDLGFTVLHVEESGLIKLLVGPYEDGNLDTARSQLSAQGIASFIR